MRLAQLTYPECAEEIREKITYAQFVNAINDGFVKRTLQLEGISSLKMAIERAMIIKVINEKFSKKKSIMIIMIQNEIIVFTIIRIKIQG